MKSFDSLAAMLLGNPNLVGTILACFLDNTVLGTKEERGKTAWQVKNEDEENFVLDRHMYDEGYEVYQPWLPKRLLRMSVMKRIHFLPYRPLVELPPEINKSVEDDLEYILKKYGKSLERKVKLVKMVEITVANT